MVKNQKTLFRKLNSSYSLAVCFLTFILYLCVAVLPKFSPGIIQLVQRDLTVREFIQSTNTQYETMLSQSVNTPLFQNHSTYINLNGLMSNLMGQQSANNRVKLKNGHLTGITTDSPSDDTLRSVADNIATLYTKQKGLGKDFLFVMTPCQISKYEDLLPVGYNDTSNDTADRLLALLEERGIACLDLRKSLYKDGISHAEAFFITDHHWTPQTGFWAYSKILEKLHEMGIFSEIDPYYTDPNNFDFTIHEESFLGSSGKRMGIYYAGIDDFCVISPKFKTSITVKYDGDDTDYQGNYPNTVNMDYPKSTFEQKDYFNFNAYGIYGHSDTVPVLRTNENAPEKSKLMLIGDSMTNIPFSLMSLYTSQCFELDMRIINGDYGTEYTSSYHDFEVYYSSFMPDCIVMLINPNGCNDTNVTFPFFS